jgi:hypothetical protein
MVRDRRLNGFIEFSTMQLGLAHYVIWLGEQGPPPGGLWQRKTPGGYRGGTGPRDM